VSPFWQNGFKNLFYFVVPASQFIASVSPLEEWLEKFI
jgi:hypothetical protein